MSCHLNSGLGTFTYDDTTTPTTATTGQQPDKPNPRSITNLRSAMLETHLAY